MDHVDHGNVEQRALRRETREQLIALFLERKAGKVLDENELNAVIEFLGNHVEPFQPQKLKHHVLKELVSEAEVLKL